MAIAGTYRQNLCISDRQQFFEYYIPSHRQLPDSGKNKKLQDVSKGKCYEVRMWAIYSPNAPNLHNYLQRNSLRYSAPELKHHNQRSDMHLIQINLIILLMCSKIQERILFPTSMFLGCLLNVNLVYKIKMSKYQ